MEYLGPVDSSSLPVRLRWKFCRVVLHLLLLLLLLLRRRRKDLFFVLPHRTHTKSFVFNLPTRPIFLLLSPLPRPRDRKRWLARAPATWVTLSPATPTTSTAAGLRSSLLPRRCRYQPVGRGTASRFSWRTQVLAQAAHARATIAVTFSGCETRGCH